MLKLKRALFGGHGPAARNTALVMAQPGQLSHDCLVLAGLLPPLVSRLLRHFQVGRCCSVQAALCRFPASLGTILWISKSRSGQTSTLCIHLAQAPISLSIKIGSLVIARHPFATSRQDTRTIRTPGIPSQSTLPLDYRSTTCTDRDTTKVDTADLLRLSSMVHPRHLSSTGRLSNSRTVRRLEGMASLRLSSSTALLLSSHTGRLPSSSMARRNSHMVLLLSSHTAHHLNSNRTAHHPRSSRTAHRRNSSTALPLPLPPAPAPSSWVLLSPHRRQPLLSASFQATTPSSTPRGSERPPR